MEEKMNQEVVEETVEETVTSEEVENTEIET